MSELAKAVTCGHSHYWTTAYNNCVMCENAALRLRCEEAEKQVADLTEKLVDAERRANEQFDCVTQVQQSARDLLKPLDRQICDLEARLAAMTREVERYKSLLRTSCQDNIEEYKVACKPTCDSHGHEHDCPTAHPGLVYDELRQQLTAMTEERDDMRQFHDRAMQSLCDDLGVDTSDGEVRFKWVSLAVADLTRQLATAQQEVVRLRELIRSGDCCRTLCSLGGAELRKERD